MSASAEFLQAVKGGDTAQAQQLLEQDASLADTRDGSGVSALLNALYMGHKDAAEAIRAKRSNIDMFEAAALGDLRALRQMLQQHPEQVHSYSSDGWTALHLAAFFGQTEAVRELLAGNAAVDARSKNNMNNTALHAAQVFKNVDAVRLLLEHGAEVNAQQHGGYTALHSAAQNGSREMVELLLKHGANKSVRDDSGKSAADHAAKYPELVLVVS